MRIIVAIALVMSAASANAATAFWTGQQQFAQSVTGMPGFRCEYQYAGKKFWAFFTGACPSSIEIE